MPENARGIADDLRARIDSGELAPGDRLPGEPALVREYGVAKMTANTALKLLVNEGLATSRPGSGTYVREFRPIRRVANERLSQSRWNSGRSIWSAETKDRQLEVADLKVTEEDAPRNVARVLNLEPSGRVIVRSRRFLVDGEAVQQATSYLPADLVRGTQIAEPNTGPGGTYARLAEIDAKPVDFVEELRARMPSEQESESLALSTGTPVIEICRTALTEDGRAVEFNQMLLDASSYALEYHLGG